MTTYVICDNCGKKFESPIQVKNLATNQLKNNRVNCPFCKTMTLAENRNMVNE